MKTITNNHEIKGRPLIEGVVIKELVSHKDERGFFEELIRKDEKFFKEGFGQLSHSFMYAGVIKAWHIHKTQIDWWYIASGDLKVALFDKREKSTTVNQLNEFLFGDHGGKCIIKIPAGVAHGCKVLGEQAELFYVTSSVYNPSEEGRIDFDDKNIGYDWLEIPPIS